MHRKFTGIKIDNIYLREFDLIDYDNYIGIILFKFGKWFVQILDLDRRWYKKLIKERINKIIGRNKKLWNAIDVHDGINQINILGFMD